jgi:hypothetical protein
MTSKAVLEAVVLCLDHYMATISDDKEFDRLVDLQNEIREELEEE